MNEGWYNDDYLIVFDNKKVNELTIAYSFHKFLPNHQLLGLLGWDEFIVADRSGDTFTVPTVPLISEYLAPYSFPQSPILKPDPRFTGRIKWYVTPIVFGGSPELDDNITWISLEQHANAVVWFNDKYRELQSK